MYRFLDRLTPDHVEAIAAQVFVEMLESGYASVAEFHYLHHDPAGAPYADGAEMAGRIAAAAGTAGIGLTLLPVLYMRGGCDGRPLEGAQRRFGTDIDRFAALHAASRAVIDRAPADFALGIAPHSLRAVDPEALREAVALGAAGPIHIHVAEQTAEVEEVQAHLGARPVDWLLANHGVDSDWCLIHCTHMTPDETRALAATEAVAGLCPITEANLGDGIVNATGFAEAGGRFGVGSDSNVHITLFGELSTLEYSQRLRDGGRAALADADRSTGRVLFEAATLGGTQAAGRPAGALASGQWADIVGFSTDNPWLCGRTGDAALDSLIFTGRGRDAITDVWSAGRHVVRGGRHVARDRVAADFMRAMADLGQDL
jgi:formimidoylglutamate deiminase